MHTKNIGSRSFAFSLYFGVVTAALGAPGELDSTFGTNGLVRIDVEQTDDAAAGVSGLDVRGRRPSPGAGEESRVFTSMARRTT